MKLKPKPGLAKRSILPQDKSTVPMGVTDHIMMFYGPPGVGKTTFVNGLGDRVLFISTDRGSRTMDAFRIECTSYNDVMAAIEALQTGSPKYDFVVLDHLDDVARWTEEHVCEMLGIDALADAEWGKGWSEFAKKFGAVITGLKRIRDSGIGFIAHESIKTIRANGIEKEVIMPEIAKRTFKLVVPLCDLVGYCTFKRVKSEATGKMVDKRILMTQPDGHVYCKDRTNRKRPTGLELLDGRSFVSTFG